MKQINVYFSDDEWKEIQKVKKKLGYSWRQIILDWGYLAGGNRKLMVMAQK